ncbi:MAG: 50S ribosomal protein L22 [Ignavibacteria bacterium]|nr:50S ribosomal protein L22 [Ignavibacteria bacterium]
MEAQAINRYVPTSPRKMRLVIDLIRGKSVDEALHILHFSPKHAAKTAEKVLRSAVSNLQNRDEAGRLEPSDIYIKKAFVDGGLVMKRISPAPMGRAYRIRKRSNHITIVVASKEKPVKQTPEAAPARKKKRTAARKTAASKKK